MEITILNILLGKESSHNLCRICMKKTENNFNLYDHISIINDSQIVHMTYAAILSDVFHLQVDWPIEELDKVCKLCADKLLEFFQFKMAATRTNNCTAQLIYNITDMLNNYSVTDCEQLVLCLEEFNGSKIKKCPQRYKNVSMKNDKLDYICKRCMNVFTNDSMLKLHIKTCKFEKINCYNCSKNFKTLELLNEHAIHCSAHNKSETNVIKCKNQILKKFVCPKCQKSFTTAVSLKLHIIRGNHDTPKEFPCKMCKKRYRKKRALIEHIKNEHGDKNLACRECGMKFGSSSMLSAHRYVKHRQKTPSKCDRCGRVFSTILSRNAHIKRVHDPTYGIRGHFLCPDCGKVFIYEKKLQEHIERVHSDMEISCNICNSTYASRRALVNHRMSKHGIHSVVCDMCGRRLWNKHVLRNHLAKIHKFAFEPSAVKLYKTREPSEKHVCSECGTILCSKDSLMVHMNCVHVEKSLPCGVCDKMFKTKQQVRAHMVVHTKERKFACNVCPSTFTTRNALTYHTRLHTGVKPYKCNYCDENFSTSSGRAVHQRKLHIEPKIACGQCTMRFHTESLLKKHTVKKHRDKFDFNVLFC